METSGNKWKHMEMLEKMYISPLINLNNVHNDYD